MSPHHLITSAMTDLKKPRVPRLTSSSQQETTTQQPAAPEHPGTPPPPRRRARRRTPGGTRQVSANFDRDDGRSAGAHLQR